MPRSKRKATRPRRGARPRGAPRPAAAAPQGPAEEIGPVVGVLELDPQGSGHLRAPQRHLNARPEDPVVATEAIRKFGLRGGELLEGPGTAVNGRGQRRVRLRRVEKIDGVAADDWLPPPRLEETTAIDPHTALRFSTPGGPLTMRIIDLFTPIGRGQRGLLVAPPRTGKTVLLQQMAHGIAENHPDIYMIVLLIDERPEEVTDMRRNVRGEVIASSNDQDIASHVRVARLVIERARRLAEQGHHIVILLDSITRLARAFNAAVGSSGRTMTGGLDIRALQEPKQIFGAARNVEEGGSLTIIATALIDTGSRADDFIFQEFKGTGNMELVLDRELANLRIWPAMNLRQSGTRKEEKLLAEDVLHKAYRLRRELDSMPPTKGMLALLERMGKHDSLEAYLASLQG
jgi:transcription termination factor Rho